MKKIISIALLLAMVLSLFAACGDNQPTEPAGDNLDSAIAYLKNMYDQSTKKEDNKLTRDKELVSAVTINGKSYPVSWSLNITSGPEIVSLTAGAAAGSQKIALLDQSEEETRFVLTGTVTDADGNTKSIDIKYFIPGVQKVEVEEGQKVVIYLVADGKYMTGIDYLYTSSSGSQKHELELTTEKAEALPLTLQTNDDGTVSFKADNGTFLFCDATHVQFVADEGDYTKFVLEAAEGGQYIKCAVANYNGNPQYLEVYSGYMTCYGMSATSNLDLYIFELQDAEGANGTIGAPATPCEHEYADGTCTKCGAADPNYIPPIEPQLPEITAPAAGTAYKFGLIQVTNGTTVYVTGEVTDRYLVTTTDMAAAADVYVEEADGGCKFYILVDGVKSYIYIYNNDAGKRSVAYGAEGNVFTFNAECGNWVTTFDGKECYLGAYNNFETISVSDTSYIDASNAGIKQFPAGFFTATEVPADLAGQIAAAAALANGEYLPYITTITGTITDEPKASSRTEGQFKFTVSDGTNNLLCYYVPVTGGTPAQGDTVTVTGYLTAYNGSAQFDETASAVLAKEEEPATPNAFLQFIDNSYAMNLNTTGFVVDGAGTYTIEWAPAAPTNGMLSLYIEVMDAYTALKDYVVSDVKVVIDGADVAVNMDFITNYGVYASMVADAAGNLTPTNNYCIELYNVMGFSSVYGGAIVPVTINEKVSVTFTLSEPAQEVEAPFADGDRIVIYATAHNKALSTLPSSEGSFYQMGVDVTVAADGTVSGYAATEIWTVIANSDGTYSFAYEGKNLGMQDSYSSMSLGAVNDKWELITLSNGSYALKNVARGNCIEWYASKNNWSTYTTDDLLANDLFHLSFVIMA